MAPFPFWSMVINGCWLLTFMAKKLERGVFKPHINTGIVLRDDNFRDFPR